MKTFKSNCFGPVFSCNRNRTIFQNVSLHFKSHFSQNLFIECGSQNQGLNRIKINKQGLWTTVFIKRNGNRNKILNLHNNPYYKYYQFCAYIILHLTNPFTYCSWNNICEASSLIICNYILRQYLTLTFNNSTNSSVFILHACT